MKSALDIHRALLADAVPHEIIRLRAPVLTADDLPRVLGVEPASCAAVRCYRADDDTLVAVLVRSGDVPDPSSLLGATGATSLRPATAAEVNEATDYAAGLVSPLCLPGDVLLLADCALGSASTLHVPAGETRVALGIALRDLLVATGARVTTLTAAPLPPAELRGRPGPPGLGSADVRVLSLPRRPRAGAGRTA